MKKYSEIKKKLSFIVTLLFIYVLLFEYILPINKVLPKPSLLVDAFISVWPVYNFFYALISTVTIIYVSLAVGYIIIIMKSRFLIMISYEYPDSIETVKIFMHLPVFMIALMFIFWFGNSIYAELLFGVLLTSFMLANRLLTESKNVKEEYILSAQSLGLSKWKIYSKIIWKAAEPEVFKELKRIHLSIWTIILIYEFAANINSLGGIYRSALLYDDFSAFIVFTVVTVIIISLGNYFLGILKDKFYNWEE